MQKSSEERSKERYTRLQQDANIIRNGRFDDRNGGGFRRTAMITLVGI